MLPRRLRLARSGPLRIVRLLERVAPLGPMPGLADEIDELCDAIDGEIGERTGEHEGEGEGKGKREAAARVVVVEFSGAAVPGSAEAQPHPPGSAFDAGEGARIVDRLARVQAPLIGVLAGDVFGFALEAALACDLRIAAHGSRFALPQVREGRMPAAGATQRLPRLIGRGRALEMILTGEPVECDEALQMGLVHRVAPAGEVSAAALQLATSMAAASPVAMRYAKEALHAGLDLTLEQGMRMELDLYLLLFSTRDRTEGITAFREKRKPRFEGS